MKLHENIELFKSIIENCRLKTGFTSSEIEKDYYVTIFLKELSERYPNLIFKGGTSLSKCYKVINRFSEDIDLNINCERKPTNGQRQNLIKNIKAICIDYNFNILNIDKIQSRRNFNRFIIDYNVKNKDRFLKSYIQVEIALQLRSYPTDLKECNSIIGIYLKNNGENKIVDKFDLKPFTIRTQCLTRTFIDKIFAICDYYIKNNLSLHSRHLYDLYKLINEIKFDDEFYRLFNQVKEDRSII